jgi:Ca2+-binding RTX toxin-like protein
MGFDHVRDYDVTGGNLDVIRVDGDLTPASVRYWRKGDDLYVGVGGSGDGIVVENWFTAQANRVEAVVFANGTTWTADMLAAARHSGTTGADVLQGDATANYLEGLEGNDALFGGAGDDVLDGGAGNDTLYGGASGYAANAGAGNDTYLFGAGSGQDTIHDHDTAAGNRDTIRLVGLNLSDVTLRRDGNDFVIGVKGTSDVLRVADWGLGAAHRIERLQFADGSVLEGAGLVAPFLGAAGNDTLTGTTDTDLLLGLEGNDTLSGGAGADVLDGGAGNDTLYGGAAGYTAAAGAGNDTYRFGRGYGQDTVFDFDSTAGNVDTIELVGLNQADVTIKRDGNYFIISVNGTSDLLRVADWNMGTAARIERVRFADGTVLQGATLVAPFYGTAGTDNMIGTVDADVMMGLAGNDTLSGGASDDVLDGGAGNDMLYGGVNGYFGGAGAGNDTYVFGRGYGQDSIFDFDATPGNVDTIKLKDLNLADVTIKRDATTFYLSVNGTADVLKMTDWSLGAAYRVERIQFADGTMLEGAALAATPFLGTSGADTIRGVADHDVLRGLDGADALLGGAGNDLLDGGAGNDTLYGGINGYTPGAGAGNDTYVFARGYGQDTVFDYDGAAGNVDTIKLLGLNAADVTIRRDASSFYIEVNGSSDRIRVADWGLGRDYRIERVEFADGSVLQGAALDSTPYLGTAGVDGMTGTADSEVMRGFAGNDTLIGAAGDDLLDGGAGDDMVRGDDGNDVVLGGDGTDTMYGGNGNDMLDGGTGADRMYGSAGDDLYWVDNTGDQANELANEGNDTVTSSVDFSIGTNVENLTLVGSADLRGTGGSGDNVLRGNTGNNVLDGGSGSDSVYGDAGNDSITGGSGSDSLSGDAGDDSLDAGAGDDYLSGGSGNDTLDGGSGTDVLQGGSGNDTLRDTTGTSVLDGGSGADLLDVEGSAGFVAGGKGNDVIEASSGLATVIAQNAGDGQDIVRASTQRVTVSLGGHLNYNDFNLRKDGNNLVLETGKGDSTTFENWYASGTAKPQYLTLQVMTAAMDGFDAAGSDPLLNHRVEQFNLKALVDSYDAERSADPTLDRWSMMHKLLDTRMAAYDSEALGGELAQAYAANGSLAGVALSAAQATVSAGTFGQGTQAMVATKLDPNSIKLA